MNVRTIIWDKPENSSERTEGKKYPAHFDLYGREAIMNKFESICKEMVVDFPRHFELHLNEIDELLNLPLEK